MSDHFRDVRNMIGWTPRADAAKFWSNIGRWVTLASEFMELERELNAAKERIKNLESALSTVENIDKVNAYQDLESANERIKRLEEALDKTSKAACKHIKQLESEVYALRLYGNKDCTAMADQALKEAKP